MLALSDADETDVPVVPVVGVVALVTITTAALTTANSIKRAIDVWEIVNTYDPLALDVVEDPLIVNWSLCARIVSVSLALFTKLRR